MIEVLVSLVILLLGLLGLIGLQAKAHNAEIESYQRAQAIVLLQDMFDRMNANRDDAYNLAYSDAAVGGGGALTDCSGKTGAESRPLRVGQPAQGRDRSLGHRQLLVRQRQQLRRRDDRRPRLHRLRRGDRTHRLGGHRASGNRGLHRQRRLAGIRAGRVAPVDAYLRLRCLRQRIAAPHRDLDGPDRGPGRILSGAPTVTRAP